MQTKTRDYLFDNYKALLIVLVVVGHFIEVEADTNTILYAVKWLIFSFHMPAFVFISGYFSKRESTVMHLFWHLLVPYFIFEVFYYVLYTFVIHKETQLYLLHPKFTLWYLVALFIWKLVTPWVKKLPGHMFLAVAAGLWVSCSQLDDNFLTLPRMLTFYPFFLAGVHFDRSWLDKLRTKRWRIGAFVLFVAINVGLVLMALSNTFSVKIFYGRYNYEYLDLTMMESVLVRLGCYIVASVLTILLLILLPEQENRFSYLGARTMAIYLFHGLIYSCFEKVYDKIGNLSDGMEILSLLAISFFIVWILSQKPFTDFMNLISNLGERRKS